MNYPETLTFMYDNLPMFTRIGQAAYHPDLNAILQLCTALDNPQNKFKSIHVAGTNGKGSTSHLLASILQEAGYKVGLFTSPHLVDFRERIRINGVMIEEEDVINFVQQNRDIITTLQPSFFEMTTAMAFSTFAEKKVAIAIIEVGLGGRLDATNCITPILSIITNISYDHQAILGNTLQEIATEKAGIIKQNIPVVISEKQTEIAEVFIQKANEMQSPIYFATDQFGQFNTIATATTLKLSICKYKKKYLENLTCQLLGTYQTKNILGVMQAIEIIRNNFVINKTALTNGLAKVVDNTGLRGRWQLLQTNPLVVLDVAHNQAGVQQLINELKRLVFNKIHWIIGMVKDKDIDSVIELLPEHATYYCCQPDIPRGLDATLLANKLNVSSRKAGVYDSPTAALAAAKTAASDDDLIIVAGSCFIMQDLL